MSFGNKMIQPGRKEKPIIGKRNGINIRSRLKANKDMNQMTNGKYKQNKAEQKFKKELLIRCQGLCENCKQLPDWRGLSKHEKVFRSHGGNPLDPTNTEILCGRCHSQKHGIQER